MRQLLTILALAGAISMQAQKTYKIDINEPSRNNDEVLEPGFTPWKFNKDVKECVLEIDGVTFTIRSGHTMRSGWSKTFVQKKENNCRLTGDGMNFDPNECGSFDLIIKGLAPGEHSIQTYHNGWQDPASTASWPITVSLNGKVMHQSVPRTEQVSSAQNATVLMTLFTVSDSNEEVTLTISTSEDEAPADADTKRIKDKTPLLNGFMIDVTDAKLQAKLPVPNDKDFHIDADDGTFALQWSPASKDVTKHYLHLGTDSTSVANSTTALYEGTDTTYTATDLYNLNTYYWRVDEETADGSVTKGLVWSFRPRHLAFPGAEGYGRFATGGRGGVVYHVTNLNNDHQPGSLLYGLVDMEGPRTIIFDVSGIIELDFEAHFVKPYATIAGQTAPGKGICLKASNINIGSETICRFIRFKRGLGIYGQNTGNAMGMSGADHAIVDHCMAAWGTDETVSGRGAKNISFQYSVISEALGIAGHKNYADGTNHGYAATIDGRIGSWHHNLLVNCEGRNWSLGGGMDGENRAIGQMDIFNNVVYNWNKRTTDGNCHEVNFVNNYYKMGPDTRHTVLFTQNYENVGHPESTWRAFVSGNIRENKNHTLTQDAKNVTYNVVLSNGDPGPKYETIVSEPFFPSHADIHTAQDALKVVTSYSGAIMPMRDEHHVRNIRETLDGTYTYVGSKSGIKGEIDSEADITEHAAGKGWEVYPEETRPAGWDTDQDGMPDWWEKITGSDPMTANHNDDPDHDGYTLLEDYLELMSHPYVIIQPNSSGTIDLKPHFAGFFGQNGKAVTPTFTLEENLGTGIFAPSINDCTLTIQATQPDAEGVYQLNVTVNDGETTFTQPFGIIITADATMAISPAWDESSIRVKSREFFTLDGKQVSSLKPHETYLMRVTDTEGHTHSAKIIKD